MKKITKNGKVIAISCVLAISASMFAGCSGSESESSKSDTSKSASTETTTAEVKEPTTLSIILPDLGRILKADTENPPLLQLEKATNTKLEINLVPQAEFGNKFNILASSGDIPDVVRLTGFSYQQYAEQGLFMDIGDLVDENGPNLKKYISEDEWNLLKYKDKTICIPYVNTAGKYATVIRQDWLDNLSLTMPKTLDEYKKILESFTFNDPDKNGQNDTYGLGAAGGWSDTYFCSDFQQIFGAFGIATNKSYLKDNKIYNSMISDEYKQAVEFIADLWNEKVIDPEIFTIKGDQAQQKLVQGKSGTLTAWWSIVPQILLQQLKMEEINPNAKWSPVTTAITGAEGKGGYPSQGNIGGALCISAKSKNAAEAVKFFDYLITQEGWELSRYGIEGEYYTGFGGTLTDLGKQATTEKWIDPLSQMVARLDLLTEWNSKSSDPIQLQNNLYMDTAANMNLYTDILYGVPATDEQKTYNADITSFEITSFISFVTGATPLTDASWDKYVDTWKNAKNGQKVFESLIKAGNDLNGTSYTAGN